ncbi:tubulin--tyrosine ligase-like protein [Musa troglodytarum]|uniref:Tubulin--tyrosine ligase-like protein n=1 Tax=Musa troglodytarum TaxID=320322 RepID=A0A9E7LBZ6_9LILI|nr:tubulin--tyrosine ligase-like protein [Musa troglodytarum]
MSNVRFGLREVPGLAERMATLMCVDLDLKSNDENLESETQEEEKSGSLDNVLEILQKEMDKVKERGVDAAIWLELEALGIDDEMLKSLELSTKFPNLVALNLWGNKLEDAETIIQEVTKCRRLKAIWLNDNRALRLMRVSLALICSSSLVCSCLLRFFSNMSRSSAFSPIMLPSLSHLNIRGNQLDQISVDDLLQLLKSFTLQTLEVDIPGPLGNSALQILEYLPNLSFLNGISASVITETGKHVIDSALQPRLPEWAPSEPLPDRVIGAMWLYLMTYRLADEEKIDETPVWYVMDELGSALRHSDDANFRVAPFLFMPDGKLASAVSLKCILSSATNPKDADIIWTSMQVDPEVKKAFELTDLHYTNQFPFEACLVMKHHLAETILKNYRGRLNHMNTPEFVREFEEEHQVNWQTIHQGIQDMIRSVFDSAAAVHPEMHNPQSRAMYGVDVMLDHLFKPKLLEVTYCPDCGRACKYDTEAIVGNGGIFRGRDFFNTVFECLFLGKTAHVTPL